MPIISPTPTLIRGTLYPSMRAAARALGLHESSVKQAMDAGRLDTVGLNPRGPRIAKALCINGVNYHSHYAAAKALGLSQQYISYLAARRGNNFTYPTKKKERA